MDIINLFKENYTMKKLGFGFMRLPVLDNDDRTKIDYETVNKMVDVFMENGFTYFDTAQVYHDGFSEVAIGKCVSDRYPREDFRLTDKLSLWAVGSPDKLQSFFDGQLERCHVTYFDNYLIHNLGIKNYEQAKKYDAFNFVRELKRQGKVKEYLSGKNMAALSTNMATLLTQFFRYLHASGVNRKTEEDAKRHCVNWVCKQGNCKLSMSLRKNTSQQGLILADDTLDKYKPIEQWQ